MADLISRAATLERMKSMAGCATCDNYNYVRCRACSWNDAMNIMEEMSEVEAVPVVRCRDCKWWEEGQTTDGVKGFCPISGCCEGPEFYCADGERRDSE